MKSNPIFLKKGTRRSPQSPRSQSDSPIRRKIKEPEHQPRPIQIAQPVQHEPSHTSTIKQSSFFSQTEVKPFQDSIQMMPTQPRSSSLSKPVTFTPLQKPQFTRHLQNTTVKQGNRATLQCTVNSSPDTTVKWYSEGNQIESSPDYSISFDRISGVCTLNISEAFPQDSGKYTCVAHNPAGTESSTAWLVVKGQSPEKDSRPHSQEIFKPKVISTRPQEPHRQGPTPIRLGPIESSKVELPISTDSPQNKPVEIIRAYTKYPSSDQEDKTPKYPSGVQQPRLPSDPHAVTMPKVLEPLRNVDLVEGGQAVFECRLQGQPLSVQWFKGDRELKSQYRHNMSYDDKNGIARLKISTVLDDDADVYTCRATNSVGEAITSAKLAPGQGN